MNILDYLVNFLLPPVTSTVNDRKTACDGPVSVPSIEGEHRIDCDGPAFIPSNYALGMEERLKIKVASHNSGGVVRFKPKEIELEKMGYLPDSPGKYFTWSDGVGLNSCALRYFIRNPDLLPEEFKGKLVVFPGTIYEEWMYSYVSAGDIVPSEKFCEFVIGLYWRTSSTTFYSSTDYSFHYGDTSRYGSRRTGWSLEKLSLSGRGSKRTTNRPGFLQGTKVVEYVIKVK